MPPWAATVHNTIAAQDFYERYAQYERRMMHVRLKRQVMEVVHRAMQGLDPLLLFNSFIHPRPLRDIVGME